MFFVRNRSTTTTTTTTTTTCRFNAALGPKKDKNKADVRTFRIFKSND